MDKEFKDIGKKMPYSVPDGFFETITALTLEKARMRKRAKRKKMILLQWLAAAAVMTGVVFTVIPLINSPEEVTSPMVVSNPLQIPAQDGITKTDPGFSAIKDLPAGDKEKVSAESVKSVDAEESMDELLASIPDEELMEWANLLHNDPFSEETENNTYHEDN